MEKNYSYPLNANWSNEELATVIKMFQLVEDAYETTALRTDILNQYRAFKQIVNSKSAEKQLGRDFKAESGYELYQVIKTAQTSEHQTIHIVEEY
ncbi:UPF0223 family protein [Paucilactobacillus wasatchensis]|uniref:Uncharacterized protein n=1 Tax=Paucilactobacillus wasatchensis TaxID=1335616 RepID=A0A0D0Y476_9LACO|nr:UPF0223 family protein [Paucilactobacillus wasatchensis]KIS03068.1 hypothetical protein WDC_1363 [Paucilactobacillus wasatchensis]